MKKTMKKHQKKTPEKNTRKKHQKKTPEKNTRKKQGKKETKVLLFSLEKGAQRVKKNKNTFKKRENPQ